MTLNYKGLIKLKEISPNKEFWVGSIFREYGVGRLDIKNDKENYYDLMLTDISTLAKDSIALINITLNSDNRGRIVAIIPNTESKYFLTAFQLQSYYSEESDIYYVEEFPTFRGL